MAALAAPDSAQAADQLRVHSANGDWAVTSGTADDDIGKVIARGAPKSHIRYAIEGADGFSIGRRSGRVAYDGTAIAAEQVSLTVTAQDSRGNAASVTHVLTVAVTQPTGEREPVPQPANGDNQRQETSEDQVGAVTFAPAAPLVGTAVTASLSDPDGPPEGATALSPTWQWAASNTQTGAFTDIAGATSASFTPGVEHDSLYLRATASYADGQGTGKTAHGVTTARVNVEPPRFTSATPTTVDVAENTTQVTELKAEGASASFNYTVSGGADAAKFQVVSAVESNALVSRLVFREAPDYESPGDVLSTTPPNAAANNEYVVRVRASYRGGLGDVNSRSVSQTITVTVTNMDEPGTVAFVPAAPLVGTAITASLGDPDGPPEGSTAFSPTWQWAASNTRTSAFTDIAGATSASFTPGVEHDSLYLRATASYADGQGTGKTAHGVTTVRVNVAPPRFTSATPTTVDVAENTTQVTVLKAEGASTSFNYAVDGGADSAKFQVVSAVESNALVSRLVFNQAPDYESPADVLSTTPANAAGNNEYVVRVRASYTSGLGDVGSRSVTRTITVTVTNVDEPGPEPTLTPEPIDPNKWKQANFPPSLPSNITRSVSEDAAVGTNVGKPVTATDPEGDSLTYALKGSAHFSIDAATGQIKVAAALDYETKKSYLLVVSVSDGKNAQGGSDPITDTSVAVTINVGDVDDVPVPQFPKRSYAFSIPESSHGSRFGGTYVSPVITVPEHSVRYRFQYLLSGADAATFAFRNDYESGVGENNRIRLAAGVDYETKQTYTFTLSAYDNTRGKLFTAESLVDTVPVTVTITDVDEPGRVSLNLPSNLVAVARNAEGDITHTLYAPGAGVGYLQYDEFWPPQMTRMSTATRVTASLADQDALVAGSVSWQWYSSPAPAGKLVAHIPLIDQLGPWTALSGNGADTATYTVQHADAGRHLRVTATYTDKYGGKTVSVATASVMQDTIHPYVYIDMHKPAGFPDVNAPFNVTVRFSEPVADFTESVLKVTNGTISNFTEQDPGRRYTATITPVEELSFYVPKTEEERKRLNKMPSDELRAFLASKTTGRVVVEVVKGSVTDNSGNKNENHAQKVTYYDKTAPTVRFDLNPGRRIGHGTYYVSLDPSESLQDSTVSADDLQVVNGTISEFKRSRFRGNAFEFFLTPTPGLAHGTSVTVTLGKGAVADEAGNWTTKATVYEAQIDTEAPTAELTVLSAKSGTIKVDIRFSEPILRVQGKPMLSVTGGTLQFLQRQKPFVEHKRWTTITMRGLESGEEWEALFTYYVTYSSRYIATIAVSEGYGTTDKPVVIEIPRGSVKDQAGLRNSQPLGPLRVTRSGETVTQEVPAERVVPTVTLEGPTPRSGRKLSNAPFEVTVTFSEDVVGFDALTEVEVTGGTVTAARKTSAQSDPDVYVLTIEPDGPGALRVSVPAEAARSKETRRYNEESNRLRYNITDAPPGPTVIIHDNPDLANPQGAEERSNAAFEVLVTFSENVVGFDGVNEIQVSGGSITAAHKVSGQGEPSQFIITVEPDGPGTLEVSVPAQAARSKETRRYNQESNTLTYTIVAGG